MKPVIHVLKTDTQIIGEFYSTWCGRKYIREEDPTGDEAAEIEEKFKDSRLCKRCEKAQHSRKYH